ncbi:CAP domain-containing protein [Streptomyces sp. NBC_00525]|uniref:CAP domain-containing protein n=1 Tax=Streptomyces sp. NBC_00525 TaxID=2903660 RepID=UPI002E805D0F|nr:CAP domain-containing protein [Streptomyces sp. NBC_00525]WUC96196.1 CAP domain-containing protein [Streptomyces sp. NBC_00525]
MGRHRRGGAAPAAGEQAEGAAGRNAAAGRRKRSALPVRTGLIGVSTALAVGAVAVASGLLPGGDGHTVSGGPTADQVRSQAAPDLLTQGGVTASPSDRASASAPASRSTDRASAPKKSGSASPDSSKPASPSASRPASDSHSASAGPSKTAAGKKAASGKKTTGGKKATGGEKAASGKKESARPSSSTAAKAPATAVTRSTAPAAPKSSAPAPSKSSTPTATATSARAAILALVNEERGKVGCSPVTASSSLASLAQRFSDDMAARGFFGHTDPDGRTPWDRAAAAGISGLGGENIARGQTDAQAVMDAWMNSDGHRANILNCDYKTLGVGVHFGAGGPWWTQDFGF